MGFPVEFTRITACGVACTVDSSQGWCKALVTGLLVSLPGPDQQV